MIILQNIYKTFGSRNILNGVSYHFPPQARIALVGNNGAGKTTLLNILCGFDAEYDGAVIKPQNVRLGYLPQILNPHPQPSILEETLSGAVELNTIIAERDMILKNLEHDYSQSNIDRYEYLERSFCAFGGYSIEEDAKGILRGLGITEEQFLLPVTSLSGGWRMRVEFAKMLLNNPNFLILDEPTNHLDLPSIKWFEQYLKKFNGSVLFVSHDKELLNRLATHILHLRAGQLTPYIGNFDNFLEQFAAKQEQNAHIAKHIKLRYEHIQKFVDTFRYTPRKAAMVQSRLKTIAKLKLMEDGIKFEELENNMQLKLETPYPSGKTVLKVIDLIIGYHKPLIKPSSFYITKGQKIAIIGFNGIGKSTLLKTLVGHHEAIDGKITFGHNVVSGYLPQEYAANLSETNSIIDNVKSAGSMKENEVRKILGNFGISGDDVFKPIAVLSGGEKIRVSLACILASKPNLLFLDEPTNHLDLSACESLANALVGYSGTVVFVSHNSYFIKSVATHVIDFKKNSVIEVIPVGNEV